MSALLLAAVLVLITTAAFVFRKRGAAPLSVPLNNGKTGLGSKNASTASLKALAPDPSKPSVRILYGTQVSNLTCMVLSSVGGIGRQVEIPVWIHVTVAVFMHADWHCRAVCQAAW